MTPVAVVALRAVQVRYGPLLAVDDVNLTILAGQRVALVGPSGAGKSTLLALCTAAVRPTSGTVRVLGQSLDASTPRQLTALRRRVGSLHQRLHLVGRLRVIHNVNAGRLGHWPWWRALLSLVRPLEVAAARQALARTGIGDKVFTRTDELSGGEQQRVALARLSVQDAELVLADEPVSSLDQARAEEVLRLLCETVASQERTLLVSLHDFELARRHCDRIIGIRAGRVLFDLPAEQVTDGLRRQLYALQPSP